jgi:putative Mg2+ transporter-C (MgtC) family protein
VGPLLIEPTGQGWTQILELGSALVLSALIGLERELRRKSAGLRTHTLIGFSSALIMLVSKYGFTDVLGEHVALDPSRVAAQIVSGIGFIGGGLIFVKRDAVRGLTTAAAVWLTTAVGMAAGAGLLVLAAATTAGYFLVVYGLTPLSTRIQRSRPQSQLIEVTYQDGRGLLRDVLACCTKRGWVVARFSTRHDVRQGAGAVDRVPDSVAVLVELRGTGGLDELAAELTEMPGVLGVNAVSPDQLEEDESD